MINNDGIRKFCIDLNVIIKSSHYGSQSHSDRISYILALIRHISNLNFDIFNQM